MLKPKGPIKSTKIKKKTEKCTALKGFGVVSRSIWSISFNLATLISKLVSWQVMDLL